MFEFKEVKVSLDRVVYVPDMDAPASRPHPFAYDITVTNHTDKVIRLVGRKWVMQEIRGETIVLEGKGIVGERPSLKPGESFKYSSQHLIAKSSHVSGIYYGETSEGQSFFVKIPDFDLMLTE